MSHLWVTLRVIVCAELWLHLKLVFNEWLDLVWAWVLVRAMVVVYVSVE